MVRQMSHSDPEKYTKPELRDKIKKNVTQGEKGGKPGQWSARKAQLVAHEYEAEGGGYKGGRGRGQKSLKKWGDEKWHTSDGKKAEREGGTTRYLPDKAWKELTPAQKKATNRKKQEGSRAGKQFVANTEQAKEARRHATKSAGKKATTSGAKKTSTKKSAAKRTPSKNTKQAAKKTAASKRGAAAKGTSSAKRGAAAKKTSSTKRGAAKKTGSGKTHKSAKTGSGKAHKGAKKRTAS